MPTPPSTTLRATAICLIVLAALGLAACGSGSKSTGNAATGGQPGTTTTGATATGTSTAKTTPSAAATSYRKCLEAHGAGLPRLTAGPRGLLAEGKLEPPKGVSQATYDAAVKACHGTALDSTGVTEGIKHFAACMRAEGVNVPDPGSSKKKGPFAYLGDIKNPKFSSALKLCAPLLRGLPKGSG